MDLRKKKKVYILMPTDEANAFKARCAEHNTLMVDVLRPTIHEFMRTHPPKVMREKTLVD